MATPDDYDSAIEVDSALPEDESGYDSSGYGSYASSLASVALSINEYRFENGRRYHTYFGADKNPLPTDEVEQDRLDIHHEIFLRLLDGQLHRAPVKNPRRILDIGTGTGIWAIEMADRYPKAEVIGTDLSPIQPTWAPPNCRFEVDDAEMDLIYQSDHFDFIHMRNVAQAISNWSSLVSEMYRCTRPGGHVELAEVGSIISSDDGTMADDNGVKIHGDLLCKAMAKAGRRPTALGTTMKADLEEAGFVDVHITERKQPLGPWPRDRRLKQIGALALMSCETAMHAYGMAAFTRILGMSAEEADKICVNAVKSVRNKNYHTYNMFFVVHGRKPERSNPKRAVNAK